MIIKQLPQTVSSVKVGQTAFTGGGDPIEFVEAMKNSWLSSSSLWNKYTSPGIITYDDAPGRHMKYCDHTRELLVDAYLMGVGCPHGIYYGSGNYKGCLYIGSAKEPFEPPDVTESTITDAYRARAWAKIYPELNDGFSLSVFLFELTELPELYRTIPTLYKLLKRVASGGVPLDKPLANGLLAYSFAYMPTYSDIVSLVDLVCSFSAKINRFIADGKKILPYHYREEMGGSTWKSGWTTGYTLNTRGLLTYNSTAWLSYEYDADFATSLLRLAGLRITPEYIWNVVPFSFVVDWVVSISDFLAQFDKDPHIRVKVHDYCDSVKVVNKNEYFLSHTYCTRGSWPWNDSSLPWLDKDFDVPTWKWEKSFYLRVPNEPEFGVALPHLDELSGRELLLAGALARA